MDPKTLKVLSTDTPDKNNRIYSREAIEKAAGNLNTRIKDRGGIYGELGISDKHDIDLAQVSHRVDEVYVDDNGNLMAKVVVLNTPQGKILQKIVAEGTNWDSVSLNARGYTPPNTITTGPNGERVINEFTFVSFDFGPNSTNKS